MFGLEDEYYQRITRLEELIEALKAECEAAWKYVGTAVIVDWDISRHQSYKQARAARQKLEEKE
jgi:uncharacterized metal-binding protein